jgi:hypothetical protein
VGTTNADRNARDFSAEPSRRETNLQQMAEGTCQPITCTACGITKPAEEFYRVRVGMQRYERAQPCAGCCAHRVASAATALAQERPRAEWEAHPRIERSDANLAGPGGRGVLMSAYAVIRNCALRVLRKGRVLGGNGWEPSHERGL